MNSNHFFKEFILKKNLDCFLCTGCPRNILPKKKFYISLISHSNWTFFFLFERAMFKVLFGRKNVSQVLFQRVTIHIDTRFQVFKILSKNLDILSKNTFQCIFFYRLHSFSNSIL